MTLLSLPVSHYRVKKFNTQINKILLLVVYTSLTINRSKKENVQSGLETNRNRKEKRALLHLKQRLNKGGETCPLS